MLLEFVVGTLPAMIDNLQSSQKVKINRVPAGNRLENTVIIMANLLNISKNSYFGYYISMLALRSCN